MVSNRRCAERGVANCWVLAAEADSHAAIAIDVTASGIPEPKIWQNVRFILVGNIPSTSIVPTVPNVATEE